jgi:hypothetical protein
MEHLAEHDPHPPNLPNLPNHNQKVVCIPPHLRNNLKEVLRSLGDLSRVTRARVSLLSCSCLRALCGGKLAVLPLLPPQKRRL